MAGEYESNPGAAVAIGSTRAGDAAYAFSRDDDVVAQLLALNVSIAEQESEEGAATQAQAIRG